VSGLEYDHDKIDEVVLALLWLTQAGNRQAWKSHDRDALERLHAKGCISDTRSKAKSVAFSEEGSAWRGNSSNVTLDGRTSTLTA
jgi:hypothetical protein